MKKQGFHQLIDKSLNYISEFLLVDILKNDSSLCIVGGDSSEKVLRSPLHRNYARNDLRHAKMESLWH